MDDPSIPQIAITTDFASTPELVVTDDDQHLSPPSSPVGLLSPHNLAHGRRVSLDVPGSPTPTFISNDGTTTVPPSPTLSSRSSVHFNTSLALRDNKPEIRTGNSSMGLLHPGDQPSPDAGGHHQRKGSTATFATSSDITVPDHHSNAHESDLKHLKSNNTSMTHVDAHVQAKRGTTEEGRKKTAEESPEAAAEEKKTTHQMELQQDEGMDPAPFAFKPYQLAHMLDPKNLDALTNFGGTDALLRGLGTDREHGLSKASLLRASTLDQKTFGDGRPGAGTVTEKEPANAQTDTSDPSATQSGHTAFTATFEDRKRVYGGNVLPHRPSKTLLQLMWTALKDKVLILLSIAAVISLALGLFQDFGTPRTNDEPPVDWVEGVAIMVAIAIVVIVGSLNDWQKERQFQTLNDKKEERGVKVIREGVEREVLVGDIALLEPGEIVPCDGIFLGGHNVRCDESGATGESDAIKSGSKVLEGVGRYVVVAVALRGDAENTPLQLKLNALAELIAKIGSVAGLLLFSALLIRFFVQLGTGEPIRNANQKGIAFVNILIISVTLIVVAVPEGLPLAVTLALAFATKRMTYEKLLVRVLGSCETMANASVVCTDKTGTLTQNVMTVVAGSVGIHGKFVRQLEDNHARTNADDKAVSRKHSEDFSIDQTRLNDVMSPELQDLFNSAIAVNSTAFQDVDPETGDTIFVGSKTETALLQFAKELGWADFKTTRDNARVIQMIPFSSERKAMGVVVELPDGCYRIYLKGASEILSKKCTSHVVVQSPGADKISGVETRRIDSLAEENISRTIIFYANQTLRTIALCYRDFESWPPTAMKKNDQDEIDYETLARDLTLIAITGIEDPLRPGVLDAVKKCGKAGVQIKMCTGDNVLTARSIALQCGIFSPGGIIMEGPVFRNLTQAERVEIVPRLQVLARSSPEDKKVLVETLKSIGDIVGVTGDGTNDGPALKTAHVGFSMGIAGTEVAKEASDIILMDDNFSSIVKAIMWGRCVNDAVRKFLQFQISTNVTAVVITFVSAVASEQEESVLTAVQLLWINIIMDTFAALALATDPASEALLDRKPDLKTAPLFSVDMYKQILGQSIYQITITLIFHFLGERFNCPNPRFNAFVFAQIFNSVNCRRLDKHLNIFEGITKNYYFIIITLIEIAIQVIIVFVGGAAFQVTPIPGREWGISIALGVVSIPLGVLIRLLPNEPFERLFNALGLLGKKEVLPTARPDAEGWDGVITQVRDNLGIFAQVRGGRIMSSNFVIKSRSARLSQEKTLTLPSVLTMVPTLMVGTIATGHGYQRGSLSDPAHSDPSRSSAALWEGRLQLHPDTPKTDPAYIKYGSANNTV
ncbi:calcium-transporting ATPase [Infundibulicybe gibba]|nr:calcium-transporting ATPase [Infundibulicybe gibba]